jgi:hypothetical protein
MMLEVVQTRIIQNVFQKFLTRSSDTKKGKRKGIIKDTNMLNFWIKYAYMVQRL